MAEHLHAKNWGAGLEKSQSFIAVKTFNPYAAGSKSKTKVLDFKPKIKGFAFDLRRVIFAFDFCRVGKSLTNKNITKQPSSPRRRGSMPRIKTWIPAPRLHWPTFTGIRKRTRVIIISPKAL
jgi:hypothetical protein